MNTTLLAFVGTVLVLAGAVDGTVNQWQGSNAGAVVVGILLVLTAILN